MTIKKFVNSKDFSCNMYILSGEKGNLIIDSGYFDSAIEEYLKSIGGVSAVLFTHGHFDHIMGIDEIAKRYPNCQFYAYDGEERMFRKSNYNCSKMARVNFETSQPIIPLIEGETTILNYKIKVIHTPGHTLGSCMFFFYEENVLFTGDTIICEGIGRTDLPTGSEADLYNSLEKIKKMSFSDDTKVCFGHGKDFKFSDLIRYNYYLRK